MGDVINPETHSPMSPMSQPAGSGLATSSSSLPLSTLADSDSPPTGGLAPSPPSSSSLSSPPSPCFHDYGDHRCDSLSPPSDVDGNVALNVTSVALDEFV